MSIASDQGEILDWYNFSMRYGYYEGVEIVQGGEFLRYSWRCPNTRNDCQEYW